MPLDPTIPLQAKAPDPLQTMGQWIGLARTKQALERETATLPTDIEKSRAEAERARIDTEKARRTLDAYVSGVQADTRSKQTAADVAEKSAPSDIAKRKDDARTAAATAQGAEAGLQTKFMQIIRDNSNRFLNDPDFNPAKPNRDGMIKKIAAARQEMIEQGVPQAMAEAATSRLIAQASTEPQNVRQTLQNSMVAGLGAQGQTDAATPSGPVINTGQQQQFFNTKPTAGPVGPVSGVAAQNQLPPTAQTVQEVTPGVYQPVFVGPQGGGIRPPGAPQAPAGMSPPAVPGSPASAPPAQPQRGFVPAGPPMGAEPNMAGIVEVVNRDRVATAEQASVASRNIPVLQEIRKYAQGASTGVLSDKRALIAGIAGYLGMSEGDLVRTNTDLLAKNSAMLALAGGNTDAARALAEAASPSTKMTPTAIHKAVNQIIAQQEMALAKQKYLGQYADNPVAYSRALTSFNAIADARVFEYPNMSVKEKEQFKNSLPPAEVEAFGRKLAAARQFGFIK